MTYNRIATPRMYMDRLSFDLANGWRTISNYSITSLDTGSAVTPSSGSFEDLFDLRPSNYITVAANTETFYIDINTGASSDTTAEANFLAILGHNFDDATARFKILHDDVSNFASATTVTASGGHTDVINGDASGDWIVAHPTSTTAAIVVSMFFICLQLSILHPSCRRVCGGGRRFRCFCD